MTTARSILAKTPLVARIGALYVITGMMIYGAVLVAPFQPTEIVYAEAAPAPLQAAAAKVAEEEPEIQGMPVRLVSDAVSIDLPVLPGEFDASTQTWTLTDNEAYFATVSQQPGTKPGTTFIYGHNRQSAFAPLSGIKVDDTVTLTLEDNTQLVYVYARDARVTPESTQIIYEKSEIPQLVLMTCEGLLSDVRRVMYFTLRDVNNG